MCLRRGTRFERFDFHCLTSPAETPGLESPAIPHGWKDGLLLSAKWTGWKAGRKHVATGRSLTCPTPVFG